MGAATADILGRTLGGNPVWAWLSALGILLGVLGFLLLCRAIISREASRSCGPCIFLVQLGLWAGSFVTIPLAGAGIVGVALAFAAQSILADLFSFLAIVIDKPFLVGDFIVVGDILGTVEKSG